LGLDAVYVATPISSHFSVAKRAYQEQLSRHLFVEKPLTSSYSESSELCELVTRDGGINMVGYLRRFMVTFIKAKELLAQEAIGEPESFAMNAFSSDFCGVRGKPQVSNGRGGVLSDLGSHAVDLALWFFGDVQVSSAKIESLTGVGAEDAVHFTVQRESGGLHGAISVSWCMEGYRMPEVALMIKGSRGTIEVNDDKVSLNLNGGDRSVWFRHNLGDNVGFWLGAPEYYREDASFVNSVITGSFAEPSFKTASKVDLLLDAIRQKAERQ
jgi:predicted dehydrogenase